MTTSNTLATTASPNAAASTANQQTFVTIPKQELLSITWKLKRIGSTAIHLHKKLESLKFGTDSIVLGEDEVGAFCDVLHDDLFVDLEEIVEQLQQSDCSDIRTVGCHLRWYSDHICFILSYLFPDPVEKIKHRPIRRTDIESIFFLFDEVKSGIYHYISELENSISDPAQADTYEISITKRIKAIQPKFRALYNKYIFSDGSQLLTTPKKLGTETEALREEICELQNQMPVRSEESMDCGIAIDQLDFLIRLISTGFAFRESDLITISGIVDRASCNLSSALDWLEPDDGGSDAKNPRD